MGELRGTLFEARSSEMTGGPKEEWGGDFEHFLFEFEGHIAKPFGECMVDFDMLTMSGRLHRESLPKQPADSEGPPDPIGLPTSVLKQQTELLLPESD